MPESNQNQKRESDPGTKDRREQQGLLFDLGELKSPALPRAKERASLKASVRSASSDQGGLLPFDQQVLPDNKSQGNSPSKDTTAAPDSSGYIRLPARRDSAGYSLLDFEAKLIPGDIQTLKRDFQLHYLADSQLEYREGQIEAAIRFFETNDNTLVIAPPGSGKTALINYWVQRELAKGNRVVIIEPNKHLCDQTEQRLRSWTHLTKQDAIVNLSGDKSQFSRRDRALAYGQEGKQIIISTADAFASDLKAIDTRSLALVVFDEVHKAKGVGSMAKCLQHLRESEVRIGAVTATPDFHDSVQLGQGSPKIEELIGGKTLYMRAAPHNVTLDHQVIGLHHYQMQRDFGRFTSAVTDLEALIRKEAQKAIMLSIERPEYQKLTAALCDSFFPDSQFQDLLHQYNQRVFGKETLRKLLRDSLTNTPLFVPQQFNQDGKTSNSGPAQLRAELDKATKAARKSRAFWSDDYQSLIASANTVMHLPSLYHQLTTRGVIPFMQSVARNICQVRFGIDISLTRSAKKDSEQARTDEALESPRETGKTAKYKMNLYEPRYQVEGDSRYLSSPVLRIYRKLAETGDGVYQDDFASRAAPRFLSLVEASSLSSLARVFPSERSTALETPQAKRSFLVNYLEEACVEIGRLGGNWFNHPKEEAIIDDVLEYFSTRGDQGRYFIYSNDKAHVRYLHKRLSTQLARLGIEVCFTLGSSGQSSVERAQNFEEISTGKAQILISTDVAIQGTDIASVERIAAYSAPWLGADLLQLMGRIRHHGSNPAVVESTQGHELSLAHVNIYSARGTMDEWRFSRAHRECRQILQSYEY